MQLIEKTVTYTVRGIKAWCKRHDCTQRELAMILGVSTTYLNDLAAQRKALVRGSAAYGKLRKLLRVMP